MYFYQVDCEGNASPVSVAHIPLCICIFFLLMVEWTIETRHSKQFNIK